MDDVTERLARIEGQLGVIGSKVDALTARLSAFDIDEAIADALAIRGLVTQINEVIHQQRIDMVAIADAQSASAAQGDQERADMTTLLTRLHTLALRHAMRLTNWERGQMRVASDAAQVDTAD
jgi:ribosomal protein L12E/L44/L45/RPP1/RPP2